MTTLIVKAGNQEFAIKNLIASQSADIILMVNELTGYNAEFVFKKDK